ncbi:MAG: hypothetical protein U0V87_07235 [Acidobacteriota bacterium]
MAVTLRLRLPSLLFVLMGATQVWAGRVLPPPTALDELRAAAATRGLQGVDLGSIIATTPAEKFSWLQRPSGRFLEIHSTDPAVRVHVPMGSALRDSDSDGIPDRGALALKLAVRTIQALRQLGLSTPADDGDGELDLYLLALDGITPSVVSLETRLPPSRGAAGFAMVDVSARQRDEAYSSAVVRAVARLAFAALDAEAPQWWLEPSVQWIQLEVVGSTLEQDRALQVRWNHPERGLDAVDPLLMQGNVTLLQGLQDSARAARVLQATWRRLAARTETQAALAAIDDGVLTTTGMTLVELQLRAGISELVGGRLPTRWAGAITSLPVLDQETSMLVAPLGVALISVTPDGRDSIATRLSFVVSEEGWTGTLIAHRVSGGWDRVPVRFDHGRAGELVLPWTDYDRAAVLLARGASGTSSGQLRFRAAGQGQSPLFALSSVGAQAVGDGLAEIRWSSAWEQELHSWVVERAQSSAGPWEICSPVPVPAVGQPRAETHYTIHDTPLHGARRVFYRVVGVTREGMRITGPAVALQTGSD